MSGLEAISEQSTFSTVDATQARNSGDAFPHGYSCMRSHYMDEQILASENSISNVAQNALSTLPSSFEGKLDSYTILSSPTRMDGDGVFQQEGLELPFNPGSNCIPNYVLGEGNFGTVYLGYAAAKAQYVAIKVIKDWHAAENEAAVQRSLSHLNHILGSLDSGTDEKSKLSFQVLELAGLGSIAKVLSSLRKLQDPGFEEQLFYCIVKDCLNGLASMHGHGFCHLDVKLENIVGNKRGIFSLIDFGCSAKEIQVVPKEKTGDKGYFSPERWLHSKNSFEPCDGAKIDVWAAGMSFLKFFLPENTFAEIQDCFYYREPGNLAAKDELEKKLIEFFEKKPPAQGSFLSFIQHLLTFDPAKRPTAEEALQHPWFIKMEETAPSWEKKVRGCFCEFVQSSYRQESTHGLSPQDLPRNHFTNFVERPSLQDKILKFLDPSSFFRRFSFSDQASLIVCQGEAGVGKTTLANYILHHKDIKKRFGLKLWFRNSNDRAALNSQYCTLAKEFGLIDDKASIEQALPLLQDYLRNRASEEICLFVYDNADDPELLRPFLPKKGYILCTSRSPAWKNVIPVGKIMQAEATELANKLLLRKDPLAEELCRELDYFPLAIAEVCGGIRKEGISLADYLKKLRSSSPVLAEQSETLFGQKLPSSILASWNITFDTLKENNPNALILLNCLAHLLPEDIPQEFIDHLGDRKAQEVLKDYQILKENSVHRLRRLVVLKKQDSDSKLQSLKKVLEALNEICNSLPPSQKERNQKLLSHAEEVIRHCSEVDASSLQSLLGKTFSWMGLTLNALGRREESKAMHEKALETVEKAHGKDHPEVGSCLLNLGDLCRTLSDHKSAVSHYEKALTIHERAYGKKHPNLEEILSKLGAAWSSLGDHKKAISFYLRTLGIAFYRPAQTAQTLQAQFTLPKEILEKPIKSLEEFSEPIENRKLDIRNGELWFCISKKPVFNGFLDSIFKSGELEKIVKISEKIKGILTRGIENRVLENRFGIEGLDLYHIQKNLDTAKQQLLHKVDEITKPSKENERQANKKVKEFIEQYFNVAMHQLHCFTSSIATQATRDKYGISIENNYQNQKYDVNLNDLHEEIKNIDNQLESSPSRELQNEKTGTAILSELLLELKKINTKLESEPNNKELQDDRETILWILAENKESAKALKQIALAQRDDLVKAWNYQGYADTNARSLVASVETNDIDTILEHYDNEQIPNLKNMLFHLSNTMMFAILKDSKPKILPPETRGMKKKFSVRTFEAITSTVSSVADASVAMAGAGASAIGTVTTSIANPFTRAITLAFKNKKKVFFGAIGASIIGIAILNSEAIVLNTSPFIHEIAERISSPWYVLGCLAIKPGCATGAYFLRKFAPISVKNIYTQFTPSLVQVPINWLCKHKDLENALDGMTHSIASRINLMRNPSSLPRQNLNQSETSHREKERLQRILDIFKRNKSNPPPSPTREIRKSLSDRMFEEIASTYSKIGNARVALIERGTSVIDSIRSNKEKATRVTTQFLSDHKKKVYFGVFGVAMIGTVILQSETAAPLDSAVANTRREDLSSLERMLEYSLVVPQIREIIGYFIRKLTPDLIKNRYAQSSPTFVQKIGNDLFKTSEEWESRLDRITDSIATRIGL